MVDVVSVLTAIASGAVVGGGYALAGYFKTTGGAPEKFIPVKALELVLLAAVLGGIGGGLGWTPMTVEAYLGGLGLLAGLTIGIQWLAQGIIRRLRGGP